MFGLEHKEAFINKSFFYYFFLKQEEIFINSWKNHEFTYKPLKNSDIQKLASLMIPSWLAKASPANFEERNMFDIN